MLQPTDNIKTDLSSQQYLHDVTQMSQKSSVDKMRTWDFLKNMGTFYYVLFTLYLKFAFWGPNQAIRSSNNI